MDIVHIVVKSFGNINNHLLIVEKAVWNCRVGGGKMEMDRQEAILEAIMKDISKMGKDIHTIHTIVLIWFILGLIGMLISVITLLSIA
jgi:septation ring formation regulator EzrA